MAAAMLPVTYWSRPIPRTTRSWECLVVSSPWVFQLGTRSSWSFGGARLRLGRGRWPTSSGVRGVGVGSLLDNGSQSTLSAEEGLTRPATQGACPARSGPRTSPTKPGHPPNPSPAPTRHLCCLSPPRPTQTPPRIGGAQSPASVSRLPAPAARPPPCRRPQSTTARRTPA
jgi:hypothetical protein